MCILMGSNNIGLNEISNNPNFDFYSKMTDEENQDNFFDPLENTQFDCRYVEQGTKFLNLDTVNNLRFLTWNIRSIQSNFGNLCELVDSYKDFNFDIIALQENWCFSNPESFALPNYNFIYLSRENNQGGGVGFYPRGTMRRSVGSQKTRTDL